MHDVFTGSNCETGHIFSHSHIHTHICLNNKHTHQIVHTHTHTHMTNTLRNQTQPHPRLLTRTQTHTDTHTRQTNYRGGEESEMRNGLLYITTLVAASDGLIKWDMSQQPGHNPASMFPLLSTTFEAISCAAYDNIIIAFFHKSALRPPRASTRLVVMYRGSVLPSHCSFTLYLSRSLTHT